MKRLILGITGASGSIYAKRLMEILAETDIYVHVVPSKTGLQVFKYETGLELSDLVAVSERFTLERYDNFFSGVASGSFQADGMVILPCSVSSLGYIAGGMSANLLHRAAAVNLKERRKLLVALREMPLTSVDLQNMLTLSNNGAVILPLCPGFYHKPQSIDDIVNFIVGKVMDGLGIENNIYERWE